MILTIEIDITKQTPDLTDKVLGRIYTIDGVEDVRLIEQSAQVDPCVDGSCSCCWTHLDERPEQQEPQRWAVFCQGCRKEWSVSYPHPGKSICAECDAKVEAQQQEPVAWIEHGSNEVPSIVVWERGGSGHYTPLYTSPQSKPWVGLTTADLDEIDAPIRERGSATIAEIYRAIEAKLREKNNG